MLSFLFSSNSSCGNYQRQLLKLWHKLWHPRRLSTCCLPSFLHLPREALVLVLSTQPPPPPPPAPPPGTSHPLNSHVPNSSPCNWLETHKLWTESFFLWACGSLNPESELLTNRDSDLLSWSPKNTDFRTGFAGTKCSLNKGKALEAFGEGSGNPLQDSCHGQRTLAGCSPWGWKESDTTEQFSVQFS